jgi:hypothetical protein
MNKSTTGESRISPSLEEFLEFAHEYGFDRSLGKSVWRYYRYRSWRFPNGDSITGDHWLVLLEKFEREAANRPFTPPEASSPQPSGSGGKR